MNQTVSLCEFGTVKGALSVDCQTNCFTGEASAIYDPCGNMISLIDKGTATEVWAQAIDKNSDATIGIYNPYNMEIPFSAQATINPSYDQPINGPIEIHIPEKGQWELEELLANQTKVNTTLGEMGISISIGGDDDCGESLCGEATERKRACEDPDDKNYEYCNCVVNCFANGDTSTIDTTEYSNNLEMFKEWECELRDKIGASHFALLVAAIGTAITATIGLVVGYWATATVITVGSVLFPVLAAVCLAFGIALGFYYDDRARWIEWLKEDAKYLTFHGTIEQTYNYYKDLEKDCRELCKDLYVE